MKIRIVRLPEFNIIDRSVNTYMPVYLDPPNTELIGIGTELGFFKSNEQIERFRIHEQIGAHLFDHDVALIGNKYYPISTRWRNGLGVVKKIYSGNIFDLLLEGGDRELMYYQDLPSTPFSLVVDQIEKTLSRIEVFNIKGIPSGNLSKIIPELYHLLEVMPSSLTKNDVDGFIDNEATLLRSGFILHQIRDWIINSGRSFSSRSNDEIINEMVTILTNLKNASLPFESNLIINSKNIDKIIKEEGIYYPKNSQEIMEECHMNHDGLFLNFPLMEFVRYCDLLLPDDCNIVFNKSTCTKFTYADETFKDFWMRYFPKFIKQPEIPYPAEVAKKIESCYYNLLSDLLKLMRYKTGFDELRYPIIMVTKTNGVNLKLTFVDKAGTEIVRSWDLSLITMASPAQYGIDL